MMKRKLAFILITTALAVATLACNLQLSSPEGITQSSTTSTEPTQPPEEDNAVEEGKEYDTIFPLPDNVQNFTGENEDGVAIFQTNFSPQEIVTFYRETFAEQGLTERKILTVIEDETFSLVFDGWSNGRAIIIQGVGMGESTNVTIRFEDV